MPATQPPDVQPVQRDGVYITRCAWLDKVDHALVVFCSDPRYREAIVEFLGTKDIVRYDQAVMPGGPAMILQDSFTFTSDRPRLKLLLDEHKITRVIGIAHLGCAYYRHRYEDVPPDEMLERQRADLVMFREEVLRLAPNVSVELYFAKGADGHAHFTPIP